jgi:hypothetical protein
MGSRFTIACFLWVYSLLDCKISHTEVAAIIEVDVATDDVDEAAVGLKTEGGEI